MGRLARCRGGGSTGLGCAAGLGRRLEGRTVGKCKCCLGRGPLGRRTMGMAAWRLGMGMACCGWRSRGHRLGLGLSVRLYEL